MTATSISPQTLTPLLSKARLLYRNCKSTNSTEYIEVSREIRGLHDVLKEIRYELAKPESPLNRPDVGRSATSRQRDLQAIVRDCIETLDQLSALLNQHDHVSTRRRNSQQVALTTIRTSLSSLKTNITILLDTVQRRETTRNTSLLQNQNGQLGSILEKVDRIAAKMNAQKSDTGSVLTTYDDDDKEVWKQFRRELVADGFDSEVLSHHKEVLRAYIRQIAQDGVLHQDGRDSGINTASSVDPVAWLRDIQDAQSPATESHEMQCVHSPVRERHELPDHPMLFTANPIELNTSPHHSRPRRASASQADRSVNYGVQAQPAIRIPHPSALNEFGQSNTRQRRTSMDVSEPAQILDAGSTTTTLELFNPNATSRAIDIPHSDRQASQTVAYSPGGSPSSHKSYASYMERGQHELDNPNTIHQSTNGIVTSRDEMPFIQDTPSSFDRSSQRPVLSPAITLNLAPDQNGNAIPASAKWTKVKRSQVSPEVLAEDNRRFEVRPEFVAVLGILSREQIQDYATRTLILRKSRARPPPHPQQSRSATYPPLTTRPNHDVHVPPSSSDDHSDTSTSTYHDSDTESSDDSRSRRRSRRNRRHGYRRSHSTELSSQSNGSYTYGSLPSNQSHAQPWLHPQSHPYPLNTGIPPQPSFSSPYQLQPTSYTYVPPPQHRHSYSGESSIPPPHDPRRSFPPQQRVRFEGDENERSMNSRRSITNNDDRIQNTYAGPSQQAAQQKKKSSWKSALTGTTLGVAAGSMLGVLFEAAQDLDF